MSETLTARVDDTVGRENVQYAVSTITMPDGGTVRVLLYRSPTVEHGVSVQVETDDLVSFVRIMLNDADLYQGNPEVD